MKHLSELEIRELTKLPENQQLERLIRDPSVLPRLLVSYRLAAAVANAAWKYLAEGDPARLQLEEALHAYAPGCHPIERLVWRVLADLYERTEGSTVEEVREAIFEAAKGAGESF